MNISFGIECIRHVSKIFSAILCTRHAQLLHVSRQRASVTGKDRRPRDG